jgi:hypothetical protein
MPRATLQKAMEAWRQCRYAEGKARDLAASLEAARAAGGDLATRAEIAGRLEAAQRIAKAARDQVEILRSQLTPADRVRFDAMKALEAEREREASE